MFLISLQPRVQWGALWVSWMKHLIMLYSHLDLDLIHLNVYSNPVYGKYKNKKRKWYFSLYKLSTVGDIIHVQYISLKGASCLGWGPSKVLTDEALRTSKSVSVHSWVLIWACRALIIYLIVLKYRFPFGIIAMSAAIYSWKMKVLSSHMQKYTLLWFSAA